MDSFTDQFESLFISAVVSTPELCCFVDMDAQTDIARDRLVSPCCKPNAPTTGYLPGHRTATILITITQYGIPNTGPWLLKAVEALFWVYISVSFVVSAGLYLTLWSTQ